ncbi:MAG: hypothetical protein LBQ62_03120, partial [Candidatus Accumulibacter sp.]|nr:hypothetical protein [Accumulibacter sp.]
MFDIFLLVVARSVSCGQMFLEKSRRRIEKTGIAQAGDSAFVIQRPKQAMQAMTFNNSAYALKIPAEKFTGTFEKAFFLREQTGILDGNLDEIPLGVPFPQ